MDRIAPAMLIIAIESLTRTCINANEALRNGHDHLNENERKALLLGIELAMVVVDMSKLPRARSRLNRLNSLFEAPNVSFRTVDREIPALIQAIRDDFTSELVIHIPMERAVYFFKILSHWKAIASFPSARTDIEAGVSCYIAANYTACVFHMMRVAEYGLRALARERGVRIVRGKPMEWANWQEIISAVSAKVAEINKKRAGPKKDAALAFYGDALGQIAAFKDTYRNLTMHARFDADEQQARIAMDRTREFMNALGIKLNEQSNRKIAWGFR